MLDQLRGKVTVMSDITAATTADPDFAQKFVGFLKYGHTVPPLRSSMDCREEASGSASYNHNIKIGHLRIVSRKLGS